MRSGSDSKGLSAFARPTLVLSTLLMLFVMPSSRAAQDQWTATIATSSIAPFLDFPGSSIHSLTKVSVYVVQGNDDNTATASAQNLYESFYYSGKRVIGSQRSSMLSAKPGTLGVIRLINSASQSALSNDEAGAAANAVLRTYLELHLRKCQLKMIVVPRGSFNLIVTALCENGLQLLPPIELEHPVPAAFLLEVVSDTGGQIQHLIM